VRLLTIVGARPQFIKAAAVSRAIARHNERGGLPALDEQIVHTGQHYDDDMSRVFFDELSIPEPIVNLGIGSGSHGMMTARMLAGLEAQMLARGPDCVLVYGDTNSTLAGALAAAKLGVPVAHVEAGLRSFRRDMPEEVNRVIVDRLADLLLCPTAAAVVNLEREGTTRGVHHVGDVMYDTALFYGERARNESRVLERLALQPGRFYLVTIHRAENTDRPARLATLLVALAKLAEQADVVLPLHPRTRRAIEALHLGLPLSRVRPIDPVSYLDMIRLEQSAHAILTDSGGVQKEAYFHGVPCVTLRDETEWVETVAAGWNVVVGADALRIQEAVATARPGRTITDYGSGHAAETIVQLLASVLEATGVARPPD
jgi:UDP-GlcNAc3NAcA epimerase